MKLTQELIDTLQGICNGKPWQWRGTAGDWHDADPRHNPCPIRYISNGLFIKISLKPEPEQDLYAEAKAAWRDGELQRLSTNGIDWSDWTERAEPAWVLPWNYYRRKPKPIRVPLGPEDVPPGSVFRHQQWEAASYRVPKEVNECGVHWFRAYTTFKELMDGGWMINRPNKRLASGMPETWEPCWKEVQP